MSPPRTPTAVPARALVLLLLLALPGCRIFISSDGDERVCTGELVPAVRVEVFNGITGLPAACGVTVVVSDGPFSETHTLPPGAGCDDGFVFTAAPERTGVYTVTVSKDGFLTWRRFDIVVTEDVCHVDTVSLRAILRTG